MIIDAYSLSILIFFLILGIGIYLDRKNIEIKYILIIRRIRKGVKLFDKIAKYKIFWKVFGTFGIIIAIYLMSIGLLNLIEFSKKIILGEITGPTGGLVLPSPTKSTIFGPGFIGIPFWIWIIIVPIIMIPHEIFHGIMARVEKVKIKSFGLLFFIIFPGAFVEPDDNQIKKIKLLSKLRIFVAGSFANFLVSLLLFTPILNIGIIPNFVWPNFVPGSVFIVDVNKTGAAFEAGIPVNSTITHINGERIEISYTDFLQKTYLLKYFKNIKAGEKLILTINGKNYSVIPKNITINNYTRPYIGVTIKPVVKNIDEAFFFSFLIPLLTWMWMLSFAVAVVNILPIYPLDGGLVLDSIVEKFARKYKKEIVSLVTAFTITLLVFTILGPYIMKSFLI
jgi:membrane-associated protease RseP (regulator of RpoE activity)